MNNSPHSGPRKKRSKDSLFDKVRDWRLRISIDDESIYKGLICAGLLVFFALAQTTLFTRFRPFGAVPDLILPLTVAIAMLFKEKWGSVFGLIGAFVIESLGGSSFTVLPILYMLTGYVVGLCSVYYFRASLAVRALYTLLTSLARMVFTLLTLAATMGNLSLMTVIPAVLIPELLANLSFAFLPHLAANLCLRSFDHQRKD